MVKSPRYIGRIVSVPLYYNFGFVGWQTISRADSTTLGLPFKHDVFVHQENCLCDVELGAQISFEIIPNEKRGEDHWRAIKARRYVGEPQRHKFGSVSGDMVFLFSKMKKFFSWITCEEPM